MNKNTQAPNEKQVSKDKNANPTVNWPVQQPATLRAQLLTWHRERGRHNLPWLALPDSNGEVNDYSIAVSEVMMQQTTVAVGVKRYPLWMTTFPTWESLARASSESVMKAWEGLGYYARARSLHKMAQKIIAEHHGKIPTARDLRLDLPGVGATTASALGAFIYGYKEPIWDANVNRIWKRWWGTNYTQRSNKEQKKWEWEMAQQAMPDRVDEIRSWTQAVMDLGATVCLPKKPICGQCPWKMSCSSYKLGIQDDLSGPKVLSLRQQMWKSWLWIYDNHQVAVYSPTEKGVWAGLWQLPEANHSCPILNHPLYTQGRHKLSHRDVTWSILKMSKSDAIKMSEGEALLAQCVWQTPGQWNQLALPQPLRKWWNNLSADARAKWLT